MRKRILFITYAAAIAAIYVVLTLIANALGLANYAIQVRFSEALTILPFFTPAAIPGLFVGCILANILIIPFVLAYVYEFEGSIPYFMLTVGIGEIIFCGILGLILLETLRRRRSQLFPQE